MTKKIKYYKNINLEEFLDEDAIILHETKKPTNNVLDIDYDLTDIDDIEIIDMDELDEEGNIFTDVSVKVVKNNNEKVLRISLDLFINNDLVKFDFDINKSTFLQLYKDFKD